MSDVSKPNVLIVMSDQHNPRFMGCSSDPLVQTPAIDRLGKRGLRFSHSYCNSPICGPSRMSFMSGRYASRIDCLDNEAQLSSDVPTFAHAFGAAGYETILSGRMHFVGMDQRHGFEKRIFSDISTAFVNLDWKLGDVLGDLIDTAGATRASLIKSGPGRTGYQAFDEALTQATVGWLEDRARSKLEGGDQRPFMMTVGYVSPHNPFVAPPQDYALYDKHITEDSLSDPQLDLLHPALRVQRRFLEGDAAVPKSDQRRTRAAYYGLCTFLDRQLGQIIDALEQTGLADNTIIVYTSDHGEQLGEHGLWWKTTFYEGSVGIPLLIAGPGVPSGRVIPQNVSLMDLGPTLLDLVGAAPMPQTDGRSFRCLIDGDPSWWSDEVISEYVDVQQGLVMRMVRQGPWKLNYYHQHEPELFNLADDPGEFDNRANDPACQAIKKMLLASALRGWDPANIEQQGRAREKELPLIREWLRRTEPREPDPLWYNSPQENWVHNRDR